MTRKSVTQETAVGWTMAETSHDAAIFIQRPGIPAGVRSGCRISLVITGERIHLDMEGREVMLQPANRDTTARILEMDTLVVAEQGSTRCWVAGVCRG